MNPSFLQFLAGAMIISLSGVMAPGPLTAVTVGKGSETPYAGALIAIGHGIIEFPLMVAIFFGFGYFFSLPYFKSVVGIVGGLYLFFISVGIFRSIRNKSFAAQSNRYSSVLSGIMLSAGNPYFLFWWASVGAALVMQAAEFGNIALAIFMVLHWCCDLAWSWFLSALSYKGGYFFGKIFQKIIFIVSGVLMIGFGGKFIYDAIKSLA